MDLVLFGRNQAAGAAEVGGWVRLSAEQVERIFRDIESKRRFARYLHSPPVLVEELH